MNLDNHPIVKTKIPFMVKHIMAKTHLPENEEELIQFSQEIAKSVIKAIEPVTSN